MSSAIHTLVGRPTNADSITDDTSGQWIRWVRHDELGAGETSVVPSGGTMDLDNDGQILPRFRCIVDLSHGLSRVLGKQLNQTAIYRVVGVQLAARPVDDANDNNVGSGILFGGRVKFITPTKHRVDAIQAARELDRVARSDNFGPVVYGNAEGATPPIFSMEEKSYQSFRFGWRTETDVSYPTIEGFSQGYAAEGGAPSWCLFDDDGALGIMSAYNEYIDGDDTSKRRGLWNNRIGSFTDTGIPFMIGWNNDEGSTPTNVDFNYQAPAGTHIDTLGGLMVIDIDFSSIEGTILPSVDDDYYLEVGIQVAGWSDF